jgi:hypothetical protein
MTRTYQSFTVYKRSELPAECFEICGYPISIMGAGLDSIQRLAIPYRRIRGVMAGSIQTDPNRRPDYPQSTECICIFTDFKFRIKIYGRHLSESVDALKHAELRRMTQWREEDGTVLDGTPWVERIKDS